MQAIRKRSLKFLKGGLDLKGKCNLSGLKKLAKGVQGADVKVDEFMEKLTKDIGAQLLRQTRKKTPVGEYSDEVSFVTKDGKQVKFTVKSGKVGGTLRRNWSISPVEKIGDMYRITIYNNTEYAPYVEYGHRKSNGKGWVPGKHMLSISSKELETAAPGFIERRIKTFVKEVLGL